MPRFYKNELADVFWEVPLLQIVGSRYGNVGHKYTTNVDNPTWTMVGGTISDGLVTGWDPGQCYATITVSHCGRSLSMDIFREGGSWVTVDSGGHEHSPYLGCGYFNDYLSECIQEYVDDNKETYSPFTGKRTLRWFQHGFFIGANWWGCQQNECGNIVPSSRDVRHDIPDWVEFICCSDANLPQGPIGKIDVLHLNSWVVQEWLC